MILFLLKIARKEFGLLSILSFQRKWTPRILCFMSSVGNTFNHTLIIPRALGNFNDSSSRWFTVNMGTGIVSILLHNLPYNGAWLYWISVIFFVLNLFLFILFIFISALRYLINPGLFMTMIRHPGVPLLLGAFPIGLATIVEMIVLVCVPAWGDWAVTLVS